jgi:4-amino-4-deoxy-L-arabinose transferase-like glycosyltransferase
LRDLGTSTRQRPSLALLLALLAATAARLAVAGMTGLTDDEAYYRLWALAPAMSYVDHPPMVAWMIAAGRFVAGDTPIGIRLCAVLAPLAGLLVLWRSCRILFGDVVGRRAVWFALAMPLLAVGGIIITPDTPSVLFWGLTFWALSELHKSGDGNWWLVVGVCAGLGLLSKYTNLFVGAGITLWLLLYRENRRWFASWQLWAGGLIAALLALPVIVWNWNHGWISFAKQFGRVVQDEPLTLRYLGEFLLAYLGLASPLIALLALVGCCRLTSSAFATRDPLPVLVIVAVLPLAAYLLVHALRDRVQANWAAPLYPFLAIAAAVAAGEGAVRPAAAGGRRGSVAVPAAALGLLISGVLLVHAVRPLVVLPGTRDPTSQMRGWAELARAIDAARTAQGACFIATWSYATTGQLAYALAGVPVVQLNERVRYTHLPPVDTSLFACPGIFVDLTRRAPLAALTRRFAEVHPLGELARAYRGVPIATYALYRLARPIDQNSPGDLP